MVDDDLVKKAQSNFISGCWEEFERFCSKFKDSNIYIYGTGIYGNFLFKALSKIGFESNIIAFLNDNAEEKKVWHDRPVIRPNNFDYNNKYDVVLVGIQNNQMIIRYLEDHNIKFIVADEDQWFYQNNLMYSVYHCIEASTISDMVYKIDFYYRKMKGLDDEILDLYNEPKSKKIIQNRLSFYKTGNCKYIESTIKNNNLYFDNEYYSLSENEFYVDVGAYDGDSISLFVSYINGKYKGIIGIEPDKISFKKLSNKCSVMHDCKLIRCATGAHNETMRFDSKGTLGSSLNENGERIEVKKLDDILSDTHPTLIKLDIEGAELDTLKGAEKILKRDKPKLAVCIYHKMEDIIDIPRYIHSIVPEYRFKVRHHSNSMLDTVLYAEV